MQNDLGNKQVMASNIEYQMNKHHMSRKELAECMGVPYTTICDWLKTNTYPRINKIEKMAQIFGISKADLVEHHNTSDYVKRAIRIPVLGRIPAGIPLEAIEDILDYEEIPADWTAGGKEYFALRIQGDSMEPEYRDGDVVIFRKTNTCDNGAHCAVIVNGHDATFKKVIRRESGVVLQPLNTKYDPSVFSNEEIEELPLNVIGVFEELRRRK